METRTYERPKVYKLENEASVIFGQDVVPPVYTAKWPGAFGLKSTKSWYLRYINTEVNLYVGPMPDISYYGVDVMNGGERKEFLAWYER